MADDPLLVPLYKIDDTAAPKNLKIEAINDSALKLSWDAPSSPEGAYKYRISEAYTNDLVFRQIGETTELSYTVSGLESYREKFYTLQSVLYDEIILTGSGTILYTSPELIPPTGIKVIPLTESSIQIAWCPVITTGITISGYRVWRSNDWESALTSIGSTQDVIYIDSGLERNKPYYYRVTSLTAYGSGSQPTPPVPPTPPIVIVNEYDGNYDYIYYA